MIFNNETDQIWKFKEDLMVNLLTTRLLKLLFFILFYESPYSLVLYLYEW